MSGPRLRFLSVLTALRSLALLRVTSTLAFQVAAPPSIGVVVACRRAAVVDLRASSKNAVDSPIAVPATDLDADLSPEERTVIGVYRSASPSVAFVTSVMNYADSDVSNFRNRYDRSRNDNAGKTDSGGNKLPDGLSLGSGSGFIVESDGYLVTNYHVIQRTYQTNDAVRKYNDRIDSLVSNATKVLGKSDIVEGIANRTKDRLKIRETVGGNKTRATVYARINSDKTYRECRIVDVKPELDMAVLKILPRNATADRSEEETFPSVPYGSSSKLLVGQRLIAIGNPFGLDRTVTSGVVSALDRAVQGIAGNEIRNCIQTDAAINPGNSGGPLLDSKGRVVGVNTMIVTTSGSNAGIGFAIPGDKVKEEARAIVAKDRVVEGGRRGTGWLGLDLAGENLGAALAKRVSRVEENGVGAFITGFKDGSPAEGLGLQPLRITDDGDVIVGDRIVAIGGNEIHTRSGALEEMRDRAVGENLALTVEGPDGERRVVYVTLGEKKYV